MLNWRKSFLVVLAMVACVFSFAWAGGEAEKDDFFKDDKPAVELPTVPSSTPVDKDTMRVNTLIVKDAKIDKAEIKKAEIELAKIKKALIRKAKINEAEVKHLKAELAEFEKAHMKYAQIKEAEVNLLKVKLAEIETANINTANIKTANIDTANINTANVNQLNNKGGGSGYLIKPASLPCSSPPCGNRSPNPKWHRVGEISSLGGIRLVYGWNNNVKETKIQSKYNSELGVVEIIVTSWDGVSDIAARLNRAYAAAVELQGRRISCNQRDCYVCEH
jgi:hypothetical protein